MKRVYPLSGPISISHEGEQIKVPEEGIDLPDHMAKLFISTHGLSETDPRKKDENVKVIERRVEVEKPDSTDPDEDLSDDIGKMKRGELLASLKAMGVKVHLPKTNDELKEMLQGAVNERQAAAFTAAIDAKAAEDAKHAAGQGQGAADTKPADEKLGEKKPDETEQQ